MPVTIDITQDLRYQQGREEEIKKSKLEKEKEKLEIAENLLKEGLAVSFVQKVIGLSIDKLEEIARRITSSNS